MSDDRLLSNWIAGYLEYTTVQESPETLHRWTALAVMSAAVRRRIWLEMEYGIVYPNLYVIIVAESAKVRKSAAMDLGRDLLLDALPAITIFRDSGTSQGLIKMLNRGSKTTQADGTTVERMHSDVAIFADEVANLFSYEKNRAAQMIIFLTRTYTCPKIYDHTTVRDSTVRLHNLYPVLLGGTDPRNLKVLPEEAIGGLTGRLIWVIESQRRHTNSGWKTANSEHAKRALLREALIHDLQIISKLEGEVQVEENARSIYDSWYQELSKRDTRDPETDAFYHRCHTTALRVAILLSLSESNNLLVVDKHIEKAIKLIESQLPETKRIALWSGGSQFEQQRAKLLHFLQQQTKNASSYRLMLKHMGMNTDEFGGLLTTLVASGLIEKLNVRIGNDEIWRLTKEGINEKVSVPDTTPASHQGPSN